MDEDSKPNSKIVLTGATGFIGRTLQRRLTAEGYSLRALVRPGSRNSAHLAPSVEHYEVSLSDPAGLTDACAGATAVVYCAGTIRGRGFEDFRAANIDGVGAIALAAAAQTPQPKVLLISSLAAMRPELSHYARSKNEGEAVLRANAEGLRWTVLRPPPVYGPHDREMIPLFRMIRAGIAVVIGPPSQRLSLLHVDDLASAIVAWLGNGEQCYGGIYSLDDGKTGGYDWPAIVEACRHRRTVATIAIPRSLLNILATMNLAAARLCRYAPMLTPGKVRELSQESWLCNNAPLTAATGWTPQIDLRHGVEQLFSSR